MDLSQPFLTALRAWGADEPNILGIALIHARATAGPESDDLVIAFLGADLADRSWVKRFGTAITVSYDKGAVLPQTSAVQWQRVRCEDGTRNFVVGKTEHLGLSGESVRDGLLTIVYDPHLMFTALLKRAARPDSD